VARILLEPISRALVIESPHPSLDDHLRSAGISATRLDRVPDDAALIRGLQDTRAQILFKRSRVAVNRAIVEAAPELHAVQLCCIGDDSVDKAACADHGVLVFNDPVSNGRSVVEMAIAHLLALSRRLYETDVAMHGHRWEKSESGRYEVLGKVLGVVGLGNIGRQVARAAEALGMQIQVHDSRQVAREVGEEMGWRVAPSMGQLFRTSDLVTVHLSARDAWDRDNRGLLDPLLAELGAERPESAPRIFLNLARGNLYGSDSLLAAVASGRIRRAAVDVYPDEPAPGGADWVNPYAEEPRITCTPHIGASTQEAQPRIARRVATTVGDFARYGALRDCVFAPREKMELADVAGRAVLAVVHSDVRGTKKAVDDAIYEAGASNLGSTHRDFANGIAYDLSVLDRPLSRAEVERLVSRARELVGDERAIRAVRQISVPRD
jgi:D-3-phosphoglycerate dehydrogenase